MPSTRELDHELSVQRGRWRGTFWSARAFRVTDVHCPPASGTTTLSNSCTRPIADRPSRRRRNQGSSAAHLRYKNIWVVDEDIDIHDYGAIDWAFAYRVNAAEDDIVFFPANFGSALIEHATKTPQHVDVRHGRWCRAC
jgi:3-polyprenyl-4-hydroxybenzoate decarboxylase